MTLSLPDDVAKALLAALYRPSKDSAGATVYTIGVYLAAQIRSPLAEALEAGDGSR